LGLLPETTFDDFTSRTQEMEFICPQHGMQRATIDSLRRYSYGCYLCGNEKKGQWAKLSIEQVVKECNEHGYVLLN